MKGIPIVIGAVIHDGLSRIREACDGRNALRR
jgi:hypothetical protein